MPEPREIADRIRIVTAPTRGSWPRSVMKSSATPTARATRPGGVPLVGRRDRVHRPSAPSPRHRAGAVRGAVRTARAPGGLRGLRGVTLPNDASVGRVSLGFMPVGIYRDIAYKFGEWRSVGWWQLSLRQRPDGHAPDEPTPPAPAGAASRRLTGDRQLQRERGAGDEHPAAMRGGDRRHDRQAEPGAGSVGGLRGRARSARTAARPAPGRAPGPNRRRSGAPGRRPNPAKR